MATTYLSMVNDVLTRLREPTVTSVTSNDYSSLIGKLVNDSKNEVENAWNWEVLRETYTVTTVADTVSYALDGSGFRFKVQDAINNSTYGFLQYKPEKFFTEYITLRPTPNKGAPKYYTYNGNDNDGDLVVDVFPIPDAAYTLRFNGFRPENPLVNSTDTTQLPAQPIILLAWSKAIEERGEDGGIAVNSQFAVARQSLIDHIAIEANRRPDDITWYWA